MNSPSDLSSAASRVGLVDALRVAQERASLYLSLVRLQSDLPIDVVVPAAEKDVEVLGYTIDGIRLHVRHPIQNLFIVAPHSPSIQALCRRKRCEFVYERDLVDMTPADIGLVVGGQDRSGWLYQQFLKWSGDILAGTNHYLVVDADTVLIRPQVFERGGRVILNYSDEMHVPYFELYRRLLMEAPVSPVSFTSHQMLFDVRILRVLKERIQEIQGCSWIDAIIRNVDPHERSGSSDYETYGQYVFKHHPESIAVEYWCNLSLRRAHNLKHPRLLSLQYGGAFKSISFHSYKD